MKILKKVWAWIVTAWCKLKASKSTASVPNMPRFPSTLRQDIIELNLKMIQEMQEAHGQFCTRTRYAVSANDKAVLIENVVSMSRITSRRTSMGVRGV